MSWVGMGCKTDDDLLNREKNQHAKLFTDRTAALFIGETQIRVMM